LSVFERMKRSLSKVFHKPTITIDKTNILLYITLILVFIISLIIRLMPLFYTDAEIHALDPFVQYRSARYILNNGFFSFMNWYDDQSWYPYGKYMGGSIFPGTPLSGITTFYVLNFIGIPVSFLEACAVTPAIMGAVTCLMMYFLGKVLANKKVGLMAAFFMMVLPGHIQRSYCGFFDNEALGILAIVATLTFFVHSLKKGSILTGILAGISLGVLSSTWGSWDYMYALLSLTAFLLVLINKYSTRLLVSFGLTVGIGWIMCTVVPRNGLDAFTGSYALISLSILALLFFIELWGRFKRSNFYFFKNISEMFNWKRVLIYSGVAILTIVIIFASTGILQYILTAFVNTSFFKGLGNRVIAIMNPLYVSQATRSVAEHIPSAWGVYYFNFSFFLLLMPVGIFFLFKRFREEDVLMILFGVTMVYFSSSYIRLQLLLAPAISIIGAFGLVFLFRPFSLIFKEKFIIGRRKKRLSKIVGKEIGFGVMAFFIWMLLYPTMHGIWNGYANIGRTPGMPDDMKEGYTWMRTVLPQGTVVMSWWDYGYRITTMGEKVTVDDNATSNSTQMGMVGRMFMSTDETTAVEICRKYNVSYVMVRWGYYQSYLAGDDGKWQWMLRIASQTLKNTKYKINVSSIWSEDEYKVTGNFFKTILWKMLITNEPYIDATKTYSTAQGGSISGADIINSKGGFYKPLWTRLANPNNNEQFKTVEGHNWDYYNPIPMGTKTSLPLDASTTIVDVDTFPGDGDSNDMLKFFDTAFFSKYRLMKVYRVNYDKADLRFDISDLRLYNNSIAYIRINNTGKRIFDIDSIKINSMEPTYKFKIGGNGTADLKNIYPGKFIDIRASEFSTIEYNQSYDVEIMIKDSSISSNTLTKTEEINAEKALNYNMSVPDSKVYLFSNNTIGFIVKNTGEDYFRLHGLTLDSYVASGFISNATSIVVAPGETQKIYVDSTSMNPSLNLNLGDFYNKMTITTDTPSNLSVEIDNLTVISGSYCGNIQNVSAWANETINFNLKNTGLYNFTIDHIRINNLIWDNYITPNPHNMFLAKGDIQSFEFKVTHDIWNLNDSNIVKINVSINLPVNMTIDEESAKLYGEYKVVNDWINYNLAVQTKKAYSNESILVNVTNWGLKTIEISDFKVSTNSTSNWIETTNFTRVPNGPNELGVNESALFLIKSNLNLNYSDLVKVKVETFEGAWNETKQLEFTRRCGNITISWTKAYQNNDTVFVNLTNTGDINITIKNIYFNGNLSASFIPIDVKYNELSMSHCTIMPGQYQLFKAKIESSQMSSIVPGGTLILNATTWEGATDAKQVTWEYNVWFKKIYAYLNDTIKLVVQNIGAQKVTINNFYVNSSLCNWTLISGSLTLDVNDKASFLLNTTYLVNSSIDLQFSDLINVTVVANYTSNLDNISFTYNNLFVLDTDYNITILQYWPNTYAFDNGTLTDANDTVCVSIMNTGAYNITISNITVNDILRNFLIISNSPYNFTIKPYQILMVRNSTNLGIDLNATEKIKINVSTNATVGTKLIWDNISVIVCYTHFNTTLLYKNNESVVVNGTVDTLYLNLTNFGNESLTLSQGSIVINNSVDFMYYYGQQAGISTIVLKPGENIKISIIITNLGPFTYPLPEPGDKVKVNLSWKTGDIYLNVI